MFHLDGFPVHAHADVFQLPEIPRQGFRLDTDKRGDCAFPIGKGDPTRFAFGQGQNEARGALQAAVAFQTLDLLDQPVQSRQGRCRER